jgi:hypothetical protein
MYVYRLCARGPTIDVPDKEKWVPKTNVTPSRQTSGVQSNPDNPVFRLLHENKQAEQKEKDKQARQEMLQYVERRDSERMLTERREEDPLEEKQQEAELSRQPTQWN